jgi:hypothetical protein
MLCQHAPARTDLSTTSGMRWKKAGAQTILTLRVILLSGVWSQVFEQVLNGFSEVTVRVAGAQSREDTRKPA